MKRCPNCGKNYRDYEQYCIVCRYKLKYVEGSKVEDYSPEPEKSSIQTKPTVECPYCHSTNTKKISGLSKMGSVAVWGVFAAGKVSKQWKCNNCKSEF